MKYTVLLRQTIALSFHPKVFIPKMHKTPDIIIILLVSFVNYYDLCTVFSLRAAYKLVGIAWIGVGGR